MTSVEVVQRFYDAVMSGDRQGRLSCLHPEIVVREASSLPFGGVWRGLDGVAQMSSVMAKALIASVVAVKSHNIGDCVLSEITLSLESKASGRTVETKVLEIHRFKDGLIIEQDPYYKDTQLVTDIYNS